MGFPCLSLASFHLDVDTVHLAAHYRNQSVIERAYGNYLGLGRLHAYVAKSCGLHVGELLVVSGHIELERTGGIDNIVNEQQTLLV
jgi:thymidylate synthase